MNKKKIIKAIGLFGLFLILAILYFLYPLMVMPDSTEYYGYLKIFYGQESMSNWNIVRGPSFPFVLYIFSLIFGNNERGILMGTFVMFAIMIILGYRIIGKIAFRSNKQKSICYIIYTLLVMFNPLLVGYMHGLLTEFVAMPMFIVYCVLSFKWINNDDRVWKKIIFSILLIFGSVFMWFLKQPYVFLCLAPIIVSSIVSLINKTKIKNFIYRITIILLSVISIVVGINVWNSTLQKNNVNMNTGRDTDTYLKAAVINGNTSFSIDFDEEHYKLGYIRDSDKISDEDKKEIEKIINGNSEYKSFKLIDVFKDYIVRDENNSEKKLVMFSKESQYTVSDSIKMYLFMATRYPKKTMKAYVTNYLALSDVIPLNMDKVSTVYYPCKGVPYLLENQTIGYSIYVEEDNMLWINEDHYLYDNVKNLKTDNNSPEWLNQIINSSFKLFNCIYRIIMVITPILLIYVLRKLFILRKKKIRNAKMDMAAILVGSSFIHLVFHTITGAIIDRYAMPAFAAVVIAALIVLFESKTEAKDIQMIEKKEKNKRISESKVLVVIPAHNEEQNIKKVIDEIKTDLPNVDTLVINDSSTDNTRKIAEENGVKCISTIYNFKYAYAVQTGIKYAYKNNYDYVIQFDGDGQHIASEAKKLLDYAEKNNSDIVIGSRYLKKDSYKAPFFRKIGTQLFVKLIKLFCKKEITDPLSGFQCLNRRVIEKYAKIGEYPEYPDANLVIDMIKQGYDIDEIPVKMRLREFGESMHGGIIKPIKYMIVMFYTVIIILLKNTGKNGR